MLKLTLTPCREDQDRYWSLVSYEGTDRVHPIRKNYRWLDTGKGWRFMCVSVSRMKRIPGLWSREWPRVLPPAPESEELRRARIRAIRAAIHVDPAKAAAEPTWRDPPGTLTEDLVVTMVAS